MAARSPDTRTISRETRPGGARRQPTAAIPPPRPAVTGTIAPPVGMSPAAAVPPSPKTLRLSVGLWFAAWAAGLFGVAAAVADGDGLRDRLTVTARAVDAAATSQEVSDAVRVTVLLVLGSVVGLVLLSLVWTVLLLRRRPWARWLLLGTGLLTLVAADMAQSTVAGGSDLDRIGLLAQAGLVVLALVLLFTRSSGRWLRGSDD